MEKENSKFKSDLDKYGLHQIIPASTTKPNYVINLLLLSAF